MVEGGDLRHPLVPDTARNLDHRVVLAVADDTHIRAQVTDRRHLVFRHQSRQADRRLHPKRLCRMG